MTSPEKLLWRYEFGGGAPEVLSESLHRLLDDLENGRAETSETRATIRLWWPELLETWSGALRAARRSTHLGEFRKAVQQIHIAERSTRDAQHLLDAIDMAERAGDEVLAIHELAETPRLRALPTPASLAQIVDAARCCINEHRPARAARMAAACIRMAKALRNAIPPSSEEHDDGVRRVREIHTLCARTAPFAGVDDDLAGDGTLATLRKLLDGDTFRLASRLLTELEIQLAGRRRFLLHYERKKAGTPLAFGAPDEVRAVVGNLSWDGAVEHYWQRSIAIHAGAVNRQQQRLDELARVLRELLTPDPPPEN